MTAVDAMRAQVIARMSGYAEVERLQRAELAGMTEQEAARIADELLQHLALLPEEPDRGSGLVEQQRIFRLAHT
jgi:hypothetical protein